MLKIISMLTVCGTCLALVACGGGSAAGSPSPPSTTYNVAIGPILTQGGPPSATSSIVLYDQQELDIAHAAVLVGTIVSPQPSQSVAPSWTSNSTAITVQSSAPGISTTAPPGMTWLVNGSSYGVAKVSAQFSAPVNSTATISVFHYPSLSIGCAFHLTPAFSFDPGAKPNGTSSDLYDTVGSDKLGPLDPCTGTVFSMPAGTAEMWHTPYGGTFIANATLSTFQTTAASTWQNAGTTFSPGSGMLIFKTKGGLIVKAMLPIGPYEVSNASGIFPY